MHYDSLVFGLSLLAASFLFGRYFSKKPSVVSDASRLRSHDGSAVNDVEQSPLAVAIKALIERNELGETLAADTKAIPGQLIWTRTLVGKTRSIRFAPPNSPQAEFILTYFEKTTIHLSTENGCGTLSIRLKHSLAFLSNGKTGEISPKTTWITYSSKLRRSRKPNKRGRESFLTEPFRGA